MGAIEYIVDEDRVAGERRLGEELGGLLGAGKRVLWLVSGGSNIDAAVRVMDGLAESKLEKLTVMLMDERYGAVGHADSNWAQLLEAGFKARRTRTVPVLTEGADIEETTNKFATSAEQEFQQAEVVIGQFGMGADGHTAGILPNSPATTDDQVWAVYYDGGQYQRITLSLYALRKVDAAYLLAYGADKSDQLQTFCNQELSITDQPVQLLKAIPRTYVFNEVMKERA